ncbi:hypothetical protein BDFB_005816 [Asbolus verrucosus]|uniref:Uncharacterized protein n=1 Tax=Asbolus verrucosus TaxID=1661398 RepID=A0A482W537_ASBVE|nr:hypothetical protein BDFB_005816 [Asbolus verrucosus]
MICKRPSTLPYSCAFTMFSPLERLPVHQPARPGIPEFKPDNTNTPYHPRDHHHYAGPSTENGSALHIQIITTVWVGHT